MEITGKNYIGYIISAQNSNYFYTFDPIKNKTNTHQFYTATTNEVNDCVNKAHVAFPIYAETSPKVRATFLRKIAQLLMNHQALLIQHYTLESGLSEARGKVELTRTIHQLNLFSNLIETKDFGIISRETAIPERTPNPKPDFSKILFPLGPVVVFGASNFPFAYSTVGGDAASALAAGCPVIIKGHPMHAGTSELVAQLVLQAAKELQLPDGVFSHLNANDNQIGEQLVKHPLVKAVGFTGSIGGGKALINYGNCRKEPIPIFCEMGSLNPVFIFQSGFEEFPSLVNQLCTSITNDSGQFCTKPGLIFIPQEIAKQVISAFKIAFQVVAPTVMLNPAICHKYLQLIQEISEIKNVETIQIQSQEANFGIPQLSICDYTTFSENSILQGEVFGPHAVLIVCNDDDLKNSVSQLTGNLTSSIWTSNEEWNKNKKFAFELFQKTGRIIFNGVSTGVEVTKSMHHGGPFPATNDARFTAIGEDAILRFLRPITIQNQNSISLSKK